MTTTRSGDALDHSQPHFANADPSPPDGSPNYPAVTPRLRRLDADQRGPNH